MTLHDDGANVTVRLASARSGPLGMGRSFSFDQTFGEETTQAQIFDVVAKPLVDATLDGYNATIFAYGQTGSGKTYTMRGPSANQGATSGESRGMMVRAVERLLEEGGRRRTAGAEVVRGFSLSASFLQLYNEVPTDCLRDVPSLPIPSTPSRDYAGQPLHSSNSSQAGGGLLSAGNMPPPLRMREDSNGGFWVENLTHEPIHSVDDAMRLISRGCANRTTAGTSTNAESSRSHAVFTLRLTADLEARGEDGMRRQRTTCLHIVDLAGSERQKEAKCASGARLREACCINKSLSALGNVISALSTSNKHVPYRDSKLTLLLRDALGGDARTAVIATVSPREACFAETLSTLHFAQRAKLVHNYVAPMKMSVVPPTPPSAKQRLFPPSTNTTSTEPEPSSSTKPPAPQISLADVMAKPPSSLAAAAHERYMKLVSVNARLVQQQQAAASAPSAENSSSSSLQEQTQVAPDDEVEVVEDLPPDTTAMAETDEVEKARKAQREAETRELKVAEQLQSLMQAMRARGEDLTAARQMANEAVKAAEEEERLESGSGGSV